VNVADLRPRVARAVAKATDYLYDRQRADGGWTDRMSSSTISTAIGLLALARADRTAHAGRLRAGLEWLRDNQRPDGGWSLVDADPPSSEHITAFAVAAFKVIDPETYAGCIDSGMAYINAHGGESVITPDLSDGGPRTWREIVPIVWAMEGLRPVDSQPSQPMEVMLFPAGLRNRASIVLPGVLGLGIGQRRVLPAGRLKRFCQWLAEPKALSWLRAVLGPNGGIEECALMCALVYSGLRSAGPDVGADIQRGCLDFLLSTMRPDGSWPIDRDLEIAVTSYCVLALAECEHDLATDPRLARTLEWLLSVQWTKPFAPLKMPPGGWSWASPSGWPESEDTAVVLAALAELGMSRLDGRIQLGLRWLEGMQNRDGSWSEWMRNSTMIHDGPCPGVTAHALMAFNKYGTGEDRAKLVSRALKYFETTQSADGSFSSLWFRDNTHGTAKVLEAYVELGMPGDPVARRAAAWLLQNQRADGAWPAKSIEGPPDGGTAEETGWAVYSLLRAGQPPFSEPVMRAVEWLVDNQNADGTWRPQGVGLYYDTLYYSDDLIAHAYPLRATARWSRVASEV
jgi:squalene-hopene/tetraprenyl-beta-curcumene cyclase